ncbi:RNA ligase RtcB family protein [Hydrogenophaga sp. A37]|uniref:RNA ligase RtcB family protein n=1 Tax=Hydrogenophaga sp. A37 TaxID=1945864 RepID=UPI00098428E9|nr:RNA ligase RtcB family protein [Hydrogenophaga sp. A37]OOG80540.1 RNA ligase RtcB family protein [Hydrogenophaga sp. A37]
MGNFVKKLSDRACVVASDATWMEDAAIAQLITTSQLEGMQRVAGMPDLHPGRGYPVGAAFFSTERFYPALVGNDIGCGMALWQTDLQASAVRLDKLEKRVGNIDGPMDDADARAQAMSDAGVLPSGHEASLGTIGGGNHFAEFQQVDTVHAPEALAALGIDKQRLLLLVHSGSRGLGECVLRQHVDAFGHAGLVADTPEAAAYLAQHDAALRYARCNRQLVAQRLLGNVRAEGRCVLDVHHNFVAPSSIHGQAGWLHRKGATPSDAGPVLIPGSRGDHSYLVRPTRVCHDTLLSLAHGAGRKWIRSACKDRLFKLMTPTQMGRTALGSRVICNDRQLIYEEAPQAYKGIDSVVQSLVGAGLIELLARTKPVLTYKTRGECCE